MTAVILTILLFVQLPTAPEPLKPDAAFGVRGTATWYCNATHLDEARASRCTRGHPDVGGDQLYAAVRTDLLELRGQTVEVCTDTACVTVTVIDCQCGGSTLVDLYSDAFRKLAPLSRGRIDVVLRAGVDSDGVGPVPTPPATDTAPAEGRTLVSGRDAGSPQAWGQP